MDIQAGEEEHTQRPQHKIHSQLVDSTSKHSNFKIPIQKVIINDQKSIKITGNPQNVHTL